MNIRKNRRLVEEGPQLRPAPPSCNQRRTLFQLVDDVLLNFVELPLGHKASHIHGIVGSRAQLERACALGEAGQEWLENRLVDVDSLYGDANLSGAGKRTANGTIDGFVQIRIREHDHRVFPSEL